MDAGGLWIGAKLLTALGSCSSRFLWDLFALVVAVILIVAAALGTDPASWLAPIRLKAAQVSANNSSDAFNLSGKRSQRLLTAESVNFFF